MKPFPLFILLSLSSSLAAPLIGTKNSVNESSFCNKYKCSFIKSEVKTAPGPNGQSFYVKDFEYKLSNGVKIIVSRDKQNQIVSTIAYMDKVSGIEWFYDNGDAFAKDFGMSFLGMNPTKKIHGECITAASLEEGYDSGTLASGKDKRLSCAFLARPISSGTVRFSITASKTKF